MAEWQVGFEDDKPYLPFILNGVDQKGTHNNLQVYTHQTPYEDIDHLWIITRYKRNMEMGMRIWRVIVPGFDDLVELLDEHEFSHIHTEVPLKADLDAFIEFEAEKLDEKPEWLR